MAIFFAFVGGLGVAVWRDLRPAGSLLVELFDTRYRYTALSALYQISGVVASGLTPLIAAWLVPAETAPSGWSRRTQWP